MNTDRDSKGNIMTNIDLTTLGAPDVEYRVPDSVKTIVHADGTVTHENPDNWVPPVGGEFTVEDDDALIPEAIEARYTGPVTLISRRDTKQGWKNAKPFTELKDMTPERVQAWVSGMNEVAGFEKFRVA